MTYPSSISEAAKTALNLAKAGGARIKTSFKDAGKAAIRTFNNNFVQKGQTVTIPQDIVVVEEDIRGSQSTVAYFISDEGSRVYPTTILRGAQPVNALGENEGTFVNPQGTAYESLVEAAKQGKDIDQWLKENAGKKLLYKDFQEVTTRNFNGEGTSTTKVWTIDLV